MFDFQASPVPVRADIGDVYRRFWDHLASPGGSLTGEQRVAIAAASRLSAPAEADLAEGLQQFAGHLMNDPATVTGDHVRAAADVSGDPQTVETIGIVCQLSAVDAFHAALDLDQPPLPNPKPGPPTGEITPDLKRRRTHVPVPPGPIPVTLDLVPAEGRMLEHMAGPMYMTYPDMEIPDFARTPGLNRSQMELVASRLSFHNECFY